jgi:hypothetical protein
MPGTVPILSRKESYPALGCRPLRLFSPFPLWGATILLESSSLGSRLQIPPDPLPTPPTVTTICHLPLPSLRGLFPREGLPERHYSMFGLPSAHHELFPPLHRLGTSCIGGVLTLYAKVPSMMRNFTMMVFCLGGVPVVTWSSINPNGITCSLVNPTNGYRTGTNFPLINLHQIKSGFIQNICRATTIYENPVYLVIGYC